MRHLRVTNQFICDEENARIINALSVDVELVDQEFSSSTSSSGSSDSNYFYEHN